jgi:hypothetical protein
MTTPNTSRILEVLSDMKTIAVNLQNGVVDVPADAQHDLHVLAQKLVKLTETK